MALTADFIKLTAREVYYLDVCLANRTEGWEFAEIGRERTHHSGMANLQVVMVAKFAKVVCNVRNISKLRWLHLTRRPSAQAGRRQDGVWGT